MQKIRLQTMKNVPKNLRFEVSPEEFREHLERTKRIEEKLIRFGNLCGHFPDNTKMVESNAGVDKVMSREEADSAMRSAIGIGAIIDKNTSLLRENNKLKEELEAIKIDTTLSDGEVALIRSIRAVKIARIAEYRTSVLCFPSEDTDTVQVWCSDTPIAFLTSSLDGVSKNKAIIDALKQIQAEQEVTK